MAGRILDGFVGGTTSYTGKDTENTFSNLIYGGQFGHHHRVGYTGPDGRPYEEWMNSAGYIRQDLIPVLMDYPKGADFMPNPELFIGALKSLIETRSKTIDGFNAKLTVSTAEVTMGKAGSEAWEDYTGVKREKSQPTHTFPEVIGMGVNKFLDAYIRYLMRDPDVGLPLVSNLMTDEERPDAWTPDLYTFSALYIEPDVQHYNVINAWLALGMYPKGTGEWTGKRDVQSDKEGTPEHSIEFAGLVLPPLPAVKSLALTVLRSLTILRQDPAKTMSMPLNEIKPKITDFDTGFNRLY